MMVEAIKYSLSVFTASIFQLTYNEAHAYNSLKCEERYMVSLYSVHINSHWLRDMKNQMISSSHISCAQTP